MQLYLFTHEFHFIEIGKKIRAHGHNFEDVISACLNWMNPMKDATDLFGHLEAPRWYNILERNRRQTLDHWLFTCEDIRQYPTPVGAHTQLYLFTHWFHLIGKKIRACGHDFEDVVSAYLNWKNPRKDVTDLIGQMEVLTVLKYSPRWHNILERNRRHADDNELWLWQGNLVWKKLVAWKERSDCKLRNMLKTLKSIKIWLKS